MSRADRVKELSRHPDWCAALIILTSKFFAQDGRVWNHVDLDHEEIYWKRILNNGTFSGGEKRLLQIAASLFSTGEKINLWQAFVYLDESATAIALRAIAAYCGVTISIQTPASPFLDALKKLSAEKGDTTS